MTEKEYVLVRNLSVVLAAGAVCKDLLEEEGVLTKEERLSVTRPISELRDRLFNRLVPLQCEDDPQCTPG